MKYRQVAFLVASSVLAVILTVVSTVHEGFAGALDYPQGSVHTALPGTLLIVRLSGYDLSGSAPGVILAVSAGRTRTFTSRGAASAPVLSPDGRTIAFGNDGIYALNRNGGHLRRVVAAPTAPCHNGPFVVSDVAWSVDGRMLAYRVHLANDMVHPCAVPGADITGIWAVDLAHGTPFRIRLDGDFTWAAARDTLIVGNKALNVRTGKSHILVPGNDASEVAVAPRSGKVAFITEWGKNHSSVWIAGPAGRHRHRIDHVNGYASQPRWSPDEHSILFVLSRVASDSTRRINVLRVARVGGSIGRPLIRLASDIGDPVWSPDSRFVAYIPMGQSQSAPSAVWVVDTRSGTQRRLMYEAGSTSLTHPFFGYLAWF
jgi:Tol biopolymer transport system component